MCTRYRDKSLEVAAGKSRGMRLNFDFEEHGPTSPNLSPQLLIANYRLVPRGFEGGGIHLLPNSVGFSFNHVI